MNHEETVKLLRECNAGIKMGLSSIDEVLPRIKDDQFKNILESGKEEHSRLGDETHKLLDQYRDDDKEPSPIAKGMSWVMTNVKMVANPTDSAIADLMTDGCNMGVKSLSRYLNQYPTADDRVVQLTNRLIRLEEDMACDMRTYL